jgi:hypothetical protein
LPDRHSGEPSTPERIDGDGAVTWSFGERKRPTLAVRLLPWVLVWLLVVALVAFLVVNQNIAASFASSARAAQGTVLAKEPNNHATVHASYEVDGVRYEVADSRIGSPNPDWDTVRVGDSVVVYYDPASPARAILYEPQARAPGEIAFVILAALILGTVIGAVLLSLPLWRHLLRDVKSQLSGKEPGV